MKISAFILLGFVSLLSACAPIPQPIYPSYPEVDHETRNMLIYKKEIAKEICSGNSFKYTFGYEKSFGAKIIADLTDILTNAAAKKGSIDVDLGVREKTRLGELLGGITPDQVDKLLKSFSVCMAENMEHYFKNHKLKDDTEWLYGEKGHPYTTGPEPENGGDDRQRKTLTCPLGKVIIPETAHCVNTARNEPISQKQIGENIYQCIWSPQPHGVGIGVEMACKTSSK